MPGYIFLVIGAIFPDIDTPNSKISHILKLPFHEIFDRHRGITHSLLGAAIFSNVISFSSEPMAIAFFIGYMSHVISDAFTVKNPEDGILIMYPHEVKLRFAGIKVGGGAETLCFCLCVVYILGLM